MPDWERLVAERLARSGLPADVRRDVAAEITTHLEQHYADLMRAGRSDAEERTLALVSDWAAFCRHIQRSKEAPMGFVRRVGIPGAAAVIAALAALKLSVYLLVVPRACGPQAVRGVTSVISGELVGDATCLTVSAGGPAHLLWLAMLIPAGALAAGLARRMGARPIHRLLAAVSPAIYLAAETVVYSVRDGWYAPIPIYYIGTFVIAPTIACALGAIAFVGGSPRSHSPSRGGAATNGPDGLASPDRSVSRFAIADAIR